MDPLTLTLLLGRLGRLTDTMATEICAAAGTTPAEIRVLAFLVHAPDNAARPSDVARFVVQTSGGLTATLNRLEQEALVERRPDPADGRGKLVVLTETGRRLQDSVLGELADATRRAVADLDLATTGAAVLDLIVALEDAAGLPSSAGFVANPIGVSA
ncbi:MAG: MarR family winged helix-turn-helix transcriptional regulator [Actinomycetota bacterium]